MGLALVSLFLLAMIFLRQRTHDDVSLIGLHSDIAFGERECVASVASGDVRDSRAKFLNRLVRPAEISFLAGRTSWGTSSTLSPLYFFGIGAFDVNRTRHC